MGYMPLDANRSSQMHAHGAVTQQGLDVAGDAKTYR